jgi:hypothetical protein
MPIVGRNRGIAAVGSVTRNGCKGLEYAFAVLESSRPARIPDQ